MSPNHISMFLYETERIFSHHQSYPWTTFSVSSFVKTKDCLMGITPFKASSLSLYLPHFILPVLGVGLNGRKRNRQTYCIYFIAVTSHDSGIGHQNERRWGHCAHSLAKELAPTYHGLSDVVSQQHKTSLLLWTFGCLILAGNTNVKGNALKKIETSSCLLLL